MQSVSVCVSLYVFVCVFDDYALTVRFDQRNFLHVYSYDTKMHPRLSFSDLKDL